jgi:integrase
MASRNNWGAIRKLPSKRFQASYIGPDRKRYNAPDTFRTKSDASAWLAQVRTEIMDGKWASPTLIAESSAQTSDTVTHFGTLASRHIDLQTNRKGELLRASTKAFYRRTVNLHLAEFLDYEVSSITRAQVQEWYAKFIATGKKTTASKAYKLLSAIMKRAVEDGTIPVNPCSIKGAHSASTDKPVDTPTPEEIVRIATEIDSKFRNLVLLAAYGGFRFSEVTELRRKDVKALEIGGEVIYEISISRAVTYVEGKYVVDKPKSDKGLRKVALSPALTPILNEHLLGLPSESDEQLLFGLADNTHLPHYVFIKAFNKAKKVAGVTRVGITPHSLRHFAGTHYHLAGASLPELMAWLGDSSIAAVQRYLHVTSRAPKIAGNMEVPANFSSLIQRETVATFHETFHETFHGSSTC